MQKAQVFAQELENELHDPFDCLFKHCWVVAVSTHGGGLSGGAEGGDGGSAGGGVEGAAMQNPHVMPHVT